MSDDRAVLGVLMAVARGIVVAEAPECLLEGASVHMALLLAVHPECGRPDPDIANG